MNDDTQTTPKAPDYSDRRGGVFVMRDGKRVRVEGALRRYVAGTPARPAAGGGK